MIKFKIFSDFFESFYNPHMEPQFADELLNDWLKENPKVEIINYQYQVSKDGYNYICIMYKENK